MLIALSGDCCCLFSSEDLLLKEDSTEIISLIDKIVTKHKHLETNKQIKFTSNVEVLHFEVDVFHFENAINNIIDNAIKYGGNTIAISIEQNSSETKIYFNDNGKALSKQQAIKIFDKFYRKTKGNIHDVKGHGLGLSYVKKIIDLHNGTIYVDSEIGRGSAFIITLPLSIKNKSKL